jgi:hypothetical protein
MDYINFITVLAYVFGTLNLILIIVKRVSEMSYPGSIKNTFDRLQGIRRYWVYKYNIIIFLVCLCWIISQ